MNYSEAELADPVLREIRFVSPHPRDGERRFVSDRLFEARHGRWYERPFVDWIPPKPTREQALFHDYARLQRQRVTDFRGVLPEECAVEVSDGRGGTRIDYNNVPIKNADGSLNKYGKALIEAHETPNRIESDLASEINAVQADERADT